MTTHFVLLAVLLVLSGFFSSSETALFSISTARAKHLAKESGRLNRLILHMKDRPHTLLTTILIGNNLVNIAASSLATAITIRFIEEMLPGRTFANAVGVATGIMTFLILVFGEIFPKTVATRNNVLVAKTVIMPIYWLSFVFYPLILFLNFIPRLAGRFGSAPHVTEEELITFVEFVHDEGQINPEEKELINNIVKLDDISVSEIMTPSADMFIIDKSAEPEVERILKSGYTRIPVIEGDIDHVVGIVNIKDLFREHTTSPDSISMERIMREPYFVPENKKLDQLLNQFKKRKDHAAIAVDEYGEVSGIVTLEDVLEAIVGDIVDETDIVKPPVVKIRNREWLVLGAADVSTVNAKLHMNIPESPDYETFSGFILEQIGRIPREKEQIVIDKYIITVKEMEGHRIKTLVVKRK
ncbi:MAG TPA: hemolysin family protein [Desulfosalsimonadaceae bacterium]|nr:hemolysin family protein [Desulfosalsimonadaceae bacterium]